MNILIAKYTKQNVKPSDILTLRHDYLFQPQPINDEGNPDYGLFLGINREDYEKGTRDRQNISGQSNLSARMILVDQFVMHQITNHSTET